MRKTWVLVGAAIAAAGLSTQAALASVEGSRSALVRVVATVMPYVKVERLVNPASLEVTAEDVGRGYVDVEGGTSLTVFTNSGEGYLVSASATAGTIARVALRIDGVGLGERLRVPSAPLTRSLLRVGYRLYLEPGASAGRHPWPVALGLSRE